MVNFHTINRQIQSIERMNKLMQRKGSQDDPDLRKIFISVVDDLRRTQEELKPMLEALEDQEQKLIMTLRFLKGYGFLRISEQLNVSERLVYLYMKKAKTNLMEMFPGKIEF